MESKSAGSRRGTRFGSIIIGRRVMRARWSSTQGWVKGIAVVVAVLAVGAVIGFLTFNPRSAEIESAAVVSADEGGRRRSVDAYAARYAGLAEHYAAGDLRSERSRSAYASRYAGMAEHYAGRVASSERAVSALAARYAGLAQHHASGSEVSRRSIRAYGARCTGIAEHYTGKSHSSRRGMAAYAIRCAGMAEHYLTTGK